MQFIFRDVHIASAAIIQTRAESECQQMDAFRVHGPLELAAAYCHAAMSCVDYCLLKSCQLF